MPEKWVLKQLQRLPLIVKVRKTQLRIKEWYDHYDGQVYVSFSGGKDSTVLAHLVHELYPEVPLVFSNTGLEYPEIQSFARRMGAEFVRPKMMFSEVISKYGYPIISKEVAFAIDYARRLTTKTGQNKRDELNGLRTGKGCDKRSQLNGDIGEKSIFNKMKWLPLCQETKFLISGQCCQQMKKNPISAYQKKSKRMPYLGTLAEESLLREQAWIKHGCNAFDNKKPTSQPLSFWTEQDILKYLYVEGYEIAEVYGEIVGVDKEGFEYEPLPGVDCRLKCTGCQRTGCIFCGFGAHLDRGDTRFQRLAKTHPKQYEYCMGGSVG